MPSMVPSIIPAIQRPRNSLSQPLPFTVPCPLSVSDMHSFCLCPPHSSVVSQTAASRCIAVWAPVPQADPPLPSWHKNSGDNKKSIRRKKYRRSRRRRRTTALDLKKQQLRQPHCHSNIWFMPSAATGQFTGCETRNHHLAYSIQRTG